METAMLIEALGWFSSLVLLATLIAQVRKQTRTSRGSGVSRALYLGQTIASLGFTTYSLLIGNWVFVATNGMLTAVAICGWIAQKSGTGPRATSLHAQRTGATLRRNATGRSGLSSPGGPLDGRRLTARRSSRALLAPSRAGRGRWGQSRRSTD